MQPAYRFTDEDSRKGAYASVAVRNGRTQAMAQRRAALDRLTDATDEAGMAIEAIEAASELARKVRDADVPLESSLDLIRHAQAVDVMHKVHRLATGQSTSNAMTANVTADAIAARLANLRSAEVDTPPPPDAT